MQNGRRAFCSGDGSDDRIYVDAEAGEIHNPSHGTNSSYRCFGFGVMSIKNIHAILGFGNHVLEMDYISGSPLLSDFFPHVMHQAYLTINVTFFTNSVEITCNYSTVAFTK